MKNKPSIKSMRRLDEVHPVLSAVVMLAMSTSKHDFFVAEGIRSIEKQKEYVEKGVSWTMDSLHLPQDDGYAHAVDLYPTGFMDLDKVTDEAYEHVCAAMMKAAEYMGVKIEWGYALWKKDKPHFQLKGY